MRTRRLALLTSAACALGVVAVAPAGAVAAPGCAPVLDEATLAADVLAADGSIPDQPAATAALSDRLTAAVTDAAAEEETAAGLWLDACGVAFYADPAGHGAEQPSEPSPEAASSIGTTTALRPLAETFTLHSKPGASRVIYLDFNGHTLSGTGWNSGLYGGAASVNLVGYDTDGNPGSFSDAEKIAVQNVWAIVAEDFAPFDIDVTTAQPAAADLERSGAADQQYGTRAVITGDAAGQSSCGCGGIAYLGVFNNYSSHSQYQPAIAFTRGSGSAAKSVAEVVSHEVGHNLGLTHMGTSSASYYTGHGAWAPIMGAGYYQPLTQWSRGEYPGSNNTQDEFTVMQGYGATLRADDHGDASSPTSLGALSDVATIHNGVISSATDTDAFTFTLPAPATVDLGVAVDAVAPNLDVDLRVFNAGGTPVASDNPTLTKTSATVYSGMDAALDDLALSAGTYTVTVDGAGHGTASTGASDYGSLGTYTLSATALVSDAPNIATTTLPPATLSQPYTASLSGSSSQTGGLTWSLASGKMPSGLTLSTNGTVTGRPSLRGLHTLRVKATDSRGVASTQALTLDVATAVAAGSMTVTTGRTGTPFSSQARATGGTAPYTFTALSLPDWATLSSTGLLTGTPTRADNATFTIRVTDAKGRTKDATLRAYIDGPLRVATEALPFNNTVVSGKYNVTNVTLTAVGGSRRYTWSTVGSLPTGSRLMTNGTLSLKGLPVGTYPVTVSVRDSLGATATQSYTIVSVAPLTSTLTATPATVGAPYSATVTPAGGSGSYTVTSSALPAGWAFDGSTLTGTPTSTRQVRVTLTVVDGYGRKTTRAIVVAPKAPVAVFTATLNAAKVGRYYSALLRGTGGTPAYAWTVASGTLPAGLALSRSGYITGKPTAAGTATVTVRLTDREGRTATRALALTVNP